LGYLNFFNENSSNNNFIVAVLAIGISGINNSFAQNDTMSMGNDTSGMMNATLAFAQGNDTMSMGNSTVMNATLPMSIIGNNGTSNSTN
jgi:hypothetical protein